MTDNANGTATIEDLARAADDAGARLADGVNDLAERLTPRRIMDDALSAAKARGNELVADAGGLVKAHPVIAGAAAAAVGLALYAGNRISRAQLDLDQDMAGYTDYDDGMAEPALSGAADAADAAGDIADAAADAAADARELVTGNPLLAILAGLAAGAALAFLFPSSSSEKRGLQAIARRMTSV